MTNNYQFVPEEYSFNEGDGNTLLILGNGFDIDLGFPTNYKDYFLSDHFPFVYNDLSSHDLGRYIFWKGQLEKWYDLENILAEYGNSCGNLSNEKVEADKKDYHKIVQGLTEYLQSIDYSKPRTESVAAQILKAVDDHLLPPTVYSFNYTDFETIAESLDLGFSNAYHVHGSLKNDDIVLGVGEYVKLNLNVSYLHKTSSMGYNPGNFLTAFDSYVNIIIFGLSLSQVDYPYFEDFFKDVASRKYEGDKKKYIRIFTYDEKSRLEILDNLRRMNSGLIKLIGYSDFDIIRTKDNMDASKIKEVIDHLSVRWEVDA